MSANLADVLANGGAVVEAGKPHLAYFAAGIVSVLAAAITVFKGVEVYRRSRLLSPLAADDEKVDELDFIVDELKIEKKHLTEHNEELRRQLNNLSGAVGNLKQANAVLEKSNFVLIKDYEKLKAENEELTLKTAKPLIKARVRKIPAKKENARKPARVSRKKG